ncbi:MAG: extracellular solute-binding protein [Blautia sp.]|nr:extracellular solute-binding protein [Blautia sp.]MDY3998053.1 extracellular solute-binding protein [Blautia sp.]
MNHCVQNGVYGIAADNNGQNFYWNLMWQNGSDIFNEETKECLFDAPESIEAMEYAVSFVEKGYSPTPADLANLTADEYFESGKTAMTFAGSWMLPEYLNIEGLNFGVAQLPANKEEGVICSGMAFSVAANTKNEDAAMKFIEYLGSDEAQKLEAESGVAIPAREGTQQPWVDQYNEQYGVDVSAFVTCMDYGHTSPGLTTASEANAVVDEYMPQVFSLTMPVEEGMKAITEGINAVYGN